MVHVYTETNPVPIKHLLLPSNRLLEIYTVSLIKAACWDKGCGTIDRLNYYVVTCNSIGANCSII